MSDTIWAEMDRHGAGRLGERKAMSGVALDVEQLAEGGKVVLSGASEDGPFRILLPPSAARALLARLAVAAEAVEAGR